MGYRGIAAWVVFVTLQVSASAHHAGSEDMDLEDPIQLTGSITRVEWINPHVIIHLQTKNAFGVDQNWLVQADTPNGLLRRGLNRATLGALTTTVAPVLTIPPGNSRATNPAPSVEIVVFQTRDKNCIPFCNGYGFTLTDPSGRTTTLDQQVHDLASELNPRQ